MAAKKKRKTRARARPREEEELDRDDPAAEEELETEETDDDLSAKADAEGTAEEIDENDLRAVDKKAEKKPSSALAPVDPLQMYMREVQRHSLLTPAEEKELAVKYYEDGDVEAARTLVTANLRLVVKLAYEYRRAYRNMMDLVQEGNIGLMQAVKRYDPYRGVKLSSYAAWWIRAYMLRFILNNWRLVKIGTTQAQRKLFFNLSKEKAKLSAMGIEPTHEELAKRLDVDKKDVIEMDRRLARADASLDAPVGDSDGRQTSRMDLLPGDGAGPDSITERAELSELLQQHLEEFRQTLEGKEAVIFDKRTVAAEPLTLQQLGNEFGVSRERVRQIEARLVGRLRTFLRERLGDAVEVWR